MQLWNKLPRIVKFLSEVLTIILKTLHLVQHFPYYNLMTSNITTPQFYQDRPT